MQVLNRATPTIDRIEQILKSELWVQDDTEGTPAQFSSRKLSHEDRDDGAFVVYQGREQLKKRAEDWCRAYLKFPRDPAHHLKSLDEIHSTLLKCHFRPGANQSARDIASRVHGVVTRLSQTPPPLGSSYMDFSKLGAEYFTSSTAQRWETLQVVQFFDSNLIRFALHMELAKGTGLIGTYLDYIDTLSALVQVSLGILQEDPCIFIIRAFLWTSWQHAISLQFHYLLGSYLRSGYDYERNSNLSLNGRRQLQEAAEENHKPPEGMQYMCNWALRLLRSDRASVTSDLRVFYQRFSEVFGQLPPRCINHDGEVVQCSGIGPYDCMRFKGMKIQDQSAHAVPCPGGCRKLFWSEDSYRERDGARAVSLRDTHDEILRYCPATERTMAVSHVWSHGQGGRPEPLTQGGTGMNECLHVRYKEIAQKFGCDSYWMDTPCIPQDHNLRKEAIANINNIFAASRLTLVCDRDVMSIDSGVKDLANMERILSVLLVCDWNLRSWTLLESLRGRKNIYLLCKNHAVVSLKDILIEIHRSGHISISNLFLTAHHLLPAFSPVSDSSKMYEDITRGFLSIEEATCLLSHRHASRPGDDVVIWSLLCGDTPYFTAADFWRSKAVTDVRVLRTGHLLCHNQRLEQPGLTWALTRPDFPEQAYREYGRELLFPDAGDRSAYGLLTEDGFRATWYCCEINGGLKSFGEMVKSAVNALQSPEERIFRDIANHYLKEDRWGALLTPRAAVGTVPDIPVVYRNDLGQLFIVVVGTNDEEKRKWGWRGIYPWPSTSLPPRGKRKQIMLV